MLTDAIGNLLTDARLAGIDRENIKSLFLKELMAFWPKEKT